MSDDDAAERQQLNIEFGSLMRVARGLCQQYGLAVDAEREGWIGRALRELAAMKAQTCDTCRHQDREPKTFRFHGVHPGPFCGKGVREPPTDDDGDLIVTTCKSLGNCCGAWEAK